METEILCPSEHTVRTTDNFDQVIVYVECDEKVFNTTTFHREFLTDGRLEDHLAIVTKNHQIEYLQKEVARLREIEKEYNKDHEDDRYDPME